MKISVEDVIKIFESIKALEAENKELKKMDELYTKCNTERIALQSELIERIEQEAIVCPEDVGCVEYIKQLQSELDKAKEALEKKDTLIFRCRQEMDTVCSQLGAEQHHINIEMNDGKIPHCSDCGSDECQYSGRPDKDACHRIIFKQALESKEVKE